MPKWVTGPFMRSKALAATATPKDSDDEGTARFTIIKLGGAETTEIVGIGNPIAHLFFSGRVTMALALIDALFIAQGNFFMKANKPKIGVSCGFLPQIPMSVR